MNLWHGWHLDHRHPWNVHADPGTNNRSRNFDGDGSKSRSGNLDMGCLSGHLSFDPRPVRLQPRQLAFFAGRHNIKTFYSCFGARDLGFDSRQGRRERARRRLGLRRQQSRLGQELVSMPRSLRQYGGRALLDAVRDLVRPLQAAIVIAHVQSGRQNCRDQPSPCLCHLHGLNPFWLIDEGPQNPLARSVNKVKIRSDLLVGSRKTRSLKAAAAISKQPPTRDTL